VEKINDKVNGI